MVSNWISWLGGRGWVCGVGGVGGGDGWMGGWCELLKTFDLSSFTICETFKTIDVSPFHTLRNV